MQSPGEPEIIPPGRPTEKRSLSDEQLDLIASLLDDIFAIPGTNIRLGLDGIIGLIPGVGDLLTGIASFLIIFGAWERKLPHITLARMVTNVAIDTLVGTVPILGDFFDVAWKSNRKNYQLLMRSSEGIPSRKQTLNDWLFLGLIILFLAVLAAIPFIIFLLMIRAVRLAWG